MIWDLDTVCELILNMGALGSGLWRKDSCMARAVLWLEVKTP